MLNKMCVNWACVWLLFSLPTSFVGWKQLIVGCDNQPRDTGEEEVSHHKQQWTTIFSPLINFNPRGNNYPHLKTWTNWQSSTMRAGRHTRPALLVLVEDCSGYSLHFSVKYHQPLCRLNITKYWIIFYCLHLIRTLGVRRRTEVGIWIQTGIRQVA